MADRANKLTLDKKAMTEAFFSDARVFGIMAAIKDYRFCWEVNKVTGFSFRLNPDLEIRWKKKGRDYFFSLYEYDEPHRFLCHYIYKNQYDGEYLLPEFRNFDFIWLLKGEDIMDETVNPLQQIIRSISSVQLLTGLGIDKITNKENLVF